MPSLKQSQSGFIVLMGMLMLVLGAGAWFGTLGSIKSNELKIQKNDVYKNQLEQIKKRMLDYAVLHPELYSSGNEPGPGYFPCPDLNGDGVVDNSAFGETSCGRNAIGNIELAVMGMVPYKIGGINYTFVDSDLDNTLFWYAVDSRFVNNSQTYSFGSASRYSALNDDLPALVSQASGGVDYPLALDGNDGIVMVLLFAGEPLAGQDRNALFTGDIVNHSTNYIEQNQGSMIDGDRFNFQSVSSDINTFNDYVVTITRAEWRAAMLSRVAVDFDGNNISDYCTTIAASDSHWFNDCVYDAGSAPSFPCTLVSGVTDNLQGQGWRSKLCPS